MSSTTTSKPRSKSSLLGWVIAAVAAVGVLVGLSVFTFVYAQGGSYLSDDPSACMNCHIMRDQFDAWNRSSHTAVATCNDCHTPHSSAIAKWAVKGLNGFNHSLAFTTGAFPEPIRIKGLNARAPYGGSVPYSKLERYPAMVRIWAGYAFSKDHNEERGHYYKLTDQLETQRIELVEQPGACANCHSADAPRLIEEMGWEEFNHTPLTSSRPTCTLGLRAPTATTRRRWNCASPARRSFNAMDRARR
jgi:cytochrome c nitrite reductase small subunit